MATKYVMYSESPDGSNMVSTPTDKTIYTGIAYMPDSISTNPNMIDNSDFRNGMRNWSTENVVPTIINNQVMRMVAYAADPEINSLRRAFYSGTNPFSSIAIGENLYSCIEARHETGGKGSLYVGQVDNRVLTPLTTTNQIYQFTMNKASTNTVSISVDFADVVQWTKIAVCKSPISSWKPSPTDWLADKSNYTWTQNKYVMYSKNPDGSGMTPIQTPETIYRGIAYIPDEIITNPNLISSSTTYQNRTVNGWDWMAPRYYLSDLGIKIDDKITVISTVKIPANAPKGIAINARFMNQNDIFTDRPTVVAERGSVNVGEEKEIYSVATVPSLVSTSNLPPVSMKIRYGRLEGDGTGESYVVQGKCDGIFLGDTVTKWKPSPQDWSADPNNYVWSQMIYTMYSASPDGSNMVETPTAQTIYRGLAYMPESISSSPNLYDGTKDFTGDKWINSTAWSTDTPYNGLTVKKRTGIWSGLCQILQAQTDEIYTLYGYVKTDTGAKFNCQYYCGLGDGRASVSLVGAYKNGVKLASSQNMESTDNFSWIAYSFKITQGGALRPGFENSVDATGMYVCGLKVVKGEYDPTATWIPSVFDWLSDKANYTWTTRNTTATRYSSTIDGSNMTTDKRPESKYVGLVSVSEDLYFRQNLLRDSAYYGTGAPKFTNLFSTNSRTETVILDGYKCTKVEIDAGLTSEYKGVYLSNNTSSNPNVLYSKIQPNDIVVFSFMIKGSVKWAAVSPTLEGSTMISLTNRKDNYPNWERVVWIGRKNLVDGAFNFYVSDTSSFTFYLRDICIQKAESFTGYKIAPQEFVLNPYNYNWEPIEKTVIKYSDNYDGSGMTSEKGINSRFMGIANIPQELYKNSNLFKNPEFTNGTSNWNGTNGSILNLLTEMPNGLPLPASSAKVISNTNAIGIATGHTTQQIEKLTPGTYTLSSYIFAAIGYGNGVSITKWRYPQGGSYIENELKTTNEKGKWVRLTLTVVVTLEDRYVFGIGGGTRPNDVVDTLYSWHPKLEKGSIATEWTPDIEDWLNDPKNYTWIPLDNRVVRYSQVSSGSNMTVDRQFDSMYRGVGYVPLDLYVNKNLLLNTDFKKLGSTGFPNYFSINAGLDYLVTGNEISLTQSTTTTDRRQYSQLISLVGSAISITSSAEVYIPSGSNLTGITNYYVRCSRSDGSFTDIASVYLNTLERDKWVTIKASGKTISDGVTVSARLAFDINSIGTIKIRNQKLEFGDVATPWKQSPDDWLSTASNYTWTELPDVLKPEHIDNVDSMFPLTNLKLSNGIYYHMNVTRETSLLYSRDIPGWTYYTILDCRFNNTLNAGNTNILLSQLEGLVIKRRKKGTFNWITLKEIPVNSPADLNVVYQDSFLPSGSEFQYALVPILTGNIEGEYVMNEVFSSFNGVFISDNTTIFKLFNAVVYGATTANTSKGMIQPIGSRYPIMVNNSDVNYRSGQISSLLMGYKFEKTREVDRLDVVNQTSNLNDYLNTNGAKVITDWNGNIFVCRISSSPTTSYNSAYGNGINTVSFDWVEQAQYDNQEEMYESGLLDTRG